MKQRNRQIIMKSQFNIGGSRGQSVKPFVTDYISRPDATSPSMAYLPPLEVGVEPGDGVAFTLDRTAISRQEVLDIADKVESRFQEKGRAIQQFVVSFAPDYLDQQGLVWDQAPIIKAGDYEGVYDDVRLRHAIRAGVQSMIDHEGYRDAKMVGCIQHDTLHLHAHIVVYEDADKPGRLKGGQERGMIQPSSMAELTHEVDRQLTLTRASRTPCEKTLAPKKEAKKDEEVSNLPQVTYDRTWENFLEVLRIRQEHEDALEALRTSIDLDRLLEDTDDTAL